MDNKYTKLLKMYESQIKINKDLLAELDELIQQLTNLMTKNYYNSGSNQLKTIRELIEMLNSNG